MYQRLRKRGLTLVEMLVAMAVLGILAVGLASMAATVHETTNFARRQGEMLQHARIACERIERTCRGATAAADFPGFWVVSKTVGSYTFPDALVVWSPANGTPANAAGPPLYSELVIYTFDSASPSDLLEITARDFAGTAPALSNTSAWRTVVETAQATSDIEKVQLTDLLRVANASSNNADWRGVIRFDTRYHPTAREWTNYQVSSITWDEMTWPLDLRGSDYGLRQSWCAIELQLVPRDQTRRGAATQETAAAFFGSATCTYSLEK